MESNDPTFKAVEELIERSEVVLGGKLTREMLENYSPEKIKVEEQRIIKNAITAGIPELVDKATIEQERNDLVHSQDYTITMYVFSKRSLVDLLQATERLVREDAESGEKEEESDGAE